MNAILIAIGVIAGIGALAALALAIADKYLAVQEDPRIGLATAALPGANCGGCGFAGCADYARALVEGTALPGACAPGGDAVNAELAKILGVAASATERRVALVKCGGTRSEAIRVGDYNGICDCAAHAIRVEDGLAVVDKRLCIGCGKCVSVCPRKLIELVPASATIHVLCNNPVRGPEVTKVCGVGCIGCHLCEKNAGGKEANHFTFNGFLAKVNYENPPTDAALVDKCPRKCIREDAHFETGN